MKKHKIPFKIFYDKDQGLARVDFVKICGKSSVVFADKLECHVPTWSVMDVSWPMFYMAGEANEIRGKVHGNKNYVEIL